MYCIGRLKGVKCILVFSCIFKRDLVIELTVNHALLQKYVQGVFVFICPILTDTVGRMVSTFDMHTSVKYGLVYLVF